MSNSLQPHGLQCARLLYPLGFSRQEYWSGLPCPPPVDLPNPGIKPKSPSLQVDSLPAEPPGKPKNTGVGSPSPGNLPNSGIEPGSPLHYRGICYQLTYQGRPLLLLSLRKLQGFEELYAKKQGQRTMCILSHR